MNHVDPDAFPGWLKPLGFFGGIGVAVWHGFDPEIFNRVVAAVGALGSCGIGVAALWNARTNATKARWAREDKAYERGLRSVSLPDNTVATDVTSHPE